MNFEESILQLEGILKEMEDKNTTLDRSLELFNKGVEISKRCAEILEEGRGNVEMLTAEIKKIKEAGEK